LEKYLKAQEYPVVQKSEFSLGTIAGIIHDEAIHMSVLNHIYC